MSDIADILASGLHGVDMVASDVAVGLILLQEEQEREQAERRMKGEVRDSELDGTQCTFNTACNMHVYIKV